MACVVGILAHVDAGKTTLAEQILYHTGVLRAPGRVDRQSAFLDYGQVERERGITVFSDQAAFSYRGRQFCLIDTPGHVDFAGEMERCLWVMDCALLVVSSVEGIQSHTATVWRLLRERKIPTLFFLNKMDRAGADPERVRTELSRQFGAFCPSFSGLQPDGSMEEELAEQLAGEDEALLERYVSAGYESELWLRTAGQMFQSGRLCPVLSGAALNGEGVVPLLDTLSLLAPQAQGDPGGAVSARVYKVRHDRSGGRIVFVKVTNGILRPRAELAIPCDGETEKGNELRSYAGPRYTPLMQAEPGELCAVTGLRLPMPGDVIGSGAVRGGRFHMQPLLEACARFPADVSPKTMLPHMRELEDEEPLLHVDWEEEHQEIHLRVMGDIQLEVLREVFFERYGIPVAFDDPQILYLETIRTPVIGVGHFEPLRHYAEVRLRLSPGPRGSGIRFTSECPTDCLAAGWQHLIETHVREKEHRGVLTGAPLTDVQVTLLAGRAHLRHTEGGDFREATYRAIRQGLMEADNVLLEPWYAFRVEVSPGLAGRVLSDVQRMGGESNAPETDGECVVLSGRAPARGMRGYARELTAFSRGLGRLSLSYDGYEPCENASEVIAAKGYDPERDLANTPDSVFCSHGAGYTVKWYDAPGAMHIRE